MYYAYWNFSVCVICASDLPEAFHEWLNSLGLIKSFETHLSTRMGVWFG